MRDNPIDRHLIIFQERVLPLTFELLNRILGSGVQNRGLAVDANRDRVKDPSND